MEHTKGKLQVMPCPDYAKYHVYHQNRYIVETDGKPEIEHGFDTRSGHWELKNGRIICSMHDIDGQKEYAHLLAAAPELLAACEGIVLWFENHFPEHKDRPVKFGVDNVRIAIAKARGGE